MLLSVFVLYWTLITEGWKVYDTCRLYRNLMINDHTPTHAYGFIYISFLFMCWIDYLHVPQNISSFMKYHLD